MYELTWIRAITDIKKDFDRIPRVQQFEDHSPATIGTPMYFINREGDGKTLITSPVVSISYLHENILEIQTVNSIYELKKL